MATGQAGTASAASAAKEPKASPPGPGGSRPGAGRRIPPVSYFLVSAVFHYLGPSFAVLLFARLPVPGVAWLRIVTAAVVFAAWRRPWRLAARLTASQRWVLLGLGAVLAGMNLVFYLAVARLPLATVSAIEFLGTVILAAAGVRTRRNLAALVITVAGVAALTEVQLRGQPLGFALAFANCAGFMLYVVLAHRIAAGPAAAAPAAGRQAAGRAGDARQAVSGLDQLGAAMMIAAIVITPFGGAAAWPAFTRPGLLLAAVGVGICSSVIPYVTDQLAMARLPRATFALLLALLPAMATIIGLVVLGQVPTTGDLIGVGLVVAGVAVHQDAPARARPAGPETRRGDARQERTTRRGGSRPHGRAGRRRGAAG
ncbi:MAG TPA: EamA family transporter [Streptosporangiaceae bacterium]